MSMRTAIALTALLASEANVADAADALEAGFRTPPESAKARIWWHVMNGNITKEGVTLDLEAMKRVGIGGAQMFDADLKTPVMVAKPVKYMSPEWLEMLRHTAKEAQRLGLELAIHSSAGWSLTGGPWVKPAEAMQKLVWSTTPVTGPRRFTDRLAEPPAGFGRFQNPVSAKTPALHYFRDVAVVAFRMPPEVHLRDANPRVTGSLPRADLEKAVDGDPRTRIALGPGTPPLQITFEFARPFTARAFAMNLTMFMHDEARDGTLEASDDGRTFRPVIALSEHIHRFTAVPRTFAFPPVTARWFRVVLYPPSKGNASVDDIDLISGARIHRAEVKAGFTLLDDSYAAIPTPPAPAGMTVPSRDIVDLTARMAPDGGLTWDVPDGNWAIVRFGHSPTGQKNLPAPVEGQGLESDKLSREAVNSYLDGFLNPISKALGPLMGKRGLTHLLSDSWEAGVQNWTPGFLGEFRRRRGYDAVPWMPAMIGHVVENAELSDRFLWDVRRTIADLVADHHYGTIAERLRARGMALYSEAPGIGLPITADQLQSKGRVDIPMGEFWLNTPTADEKVPTFQVTKGAADCKEASAAGHIYGKPIIAAEAFSGAKEVNAWELSPFSLKALGDLHFTYGINRFVLHEYAHQAFRDRAPGFTLGPHGTHFGRLNNWWEQSRAWFSYVSRSQHLLQQGLFVADLAYFYGENAPVEGALRDKIDPVPPRGYDYDFVNAEVILTRMTVRDGRLMLPDGMSYRALVLPPSRDMSLALARKIRDLVKEGATVIGPRPTRPSGLEGWPQSDTELSKLTDEVWGSCTGSAACENRFGQGRVITGKPPLEVLEGAGIPQDFTFKSPNAQLVYIHRRTKDTDIYFVSNQRARTEQVSCTFRVSGKAPELWDASSGRIERTVVHTSSGDRTTIPLRLDPAGSVFVVFRRAATGATIATLEKDGAAPLTGELVSSDRGHPQLLAFESGRYELVGGDGVPRVVDVAALPSEMAISGPFQLRFPPRRGAPPEVKLERLASWTDHGNAGIRHFSGTATYATDVTVPATLARGHRLFLDLGVVKEMAELKVNGRSLGILWKPPFRADVTTAIRPGRNRIEIAVTNVWSNRLIADSGRPEAERVTWTTHNPYKPDSPLLPSGLLGPVRLVPARLVSPGTNP